MSKYNILFSLEKNLYLDGAPVLLEAGALVSNTESGRVHIQLKFKNLSNTTISMVKVSFVLMDSVGREIGRSEKQYIDLKAKLNESFCDKDPAFLIDNTVRKFSAIIEEICFTDGNIWTVPENAVWEKIPTAQSIKQSLTTSEAIDEFKLVYCKQAQFIPFAHKDLWVCSCGNVNKNAHEKCCSCGANFADMESVDNETLKKNNIYRNATVLVNKSVSSEIEKGIALFGRILDWKDSTKKIEEAKQKLVVISKNEKDIQEKKAKQRKKNIFIATLSCVAVIVLIIGVSIASSISKANKYTRAQDYMAENSLSGYAIAMDLLDDLKGYKNADKLYLRASYMYNGNYKEIVKKDNLTEFVIPDGVTSIGEEAFRGCSNLTSITIPDSVTSIGEDAFRACSMTGVYITDIEAWCNISFDDSDANPLYWAKNLYLNNELVTRLEIPNTVTEIKSCAFYNCSSLTSITIPDSVTSIGSHAFYNCSSLTSITIPDNVTSIGGFAFDSCSSLTSVVIGDSVTSIGGFAFYNCSSLTSVVIGDSVTSIGDWAFDSCSSLTGVYITDIEAWCNISFDHSYANPLYWAKNLYLNNELVTRLEIPNTVKTIKSYAFYNCNSLTSVVIGDNVTSIGGFAFDSCSSLTSVVIGDSVTSIGEDAFRACSSLTSITIPDSVTSIGFYAFSNCSKLTIYCEADSKPSSWSYYWNPNNRPVVWGYKGN